MSEWILTKDELPEEDVVVETKIDDEGGIRNEQRLVIFHGRWHVEDRSLYIYYTPTHWRSLPNTECL